MAANAGSAYVTLLPSLKGFNSKMSSELGPAADKAGKDAGRRLGGGLKGGLKGIASSAFAPLAAGMAGLGAIHAFAGFIADARESAKISALTSQVIKSTGGAAKLTASQIGDLATSVSNKTGVDDEAIQSGENLLLTFTNIKNEAGKGNDIFTQTTGIMTDMSVALGQDMKSSAIQLGKALNDPVKGVSALSKVGVSFTAQQKEQIKTLVDSGRSMDAQKVILKELGREFGGAAAAASTPMDKLKVTLGNVGEAIGGKLIPVVDGMATLLSNIIPVVSGVFGVFGTLTGFINSNKTAFLIAGGIIATIFTPALVAMGVAAVISAAQSVAAWVSSTAASASALAAQSLAVVKTVAGWVLMGAQALLGAARMAAAWLIALGPVGLVIAAVVAVTVLVIKNWDTIKRVTVAVWNAVWSFISGIVSTVVNFVKGHWQLLVAILTGPIGVAVLLIKNHWATIKADVSATFNWVKSTISTVFGAVVSFLRTNVDKVVGFFTGLPGRISGVFGGMFDGLKNAFRSAINFIIDGWNSLHFGIPEFDTHIPGIGKVGGGSVGVPHIPRLAKGGIVDRPTIALIGEAGPEAVVPLGKGHGGPPELPPLTINNYGRDVTPGTVVQGLNQWHVVNGAPLLAGAGLGGF